MTKQDDNLEELLLNDNFYSFPKPISSSSSSDHLTNLRKSVKIPNSISSNSINTSYLNPQEFSLLESVSEDSQIPSTNLNSNNPFLPKKSKPLVNPYQVQSERTSFMKNSPSMKALENILTSKDNSTKNSSTIKELINENDEEVDPQNPVNISSLSLNNQSIDTNRASTYSVQTFQTARSTSRDSLDESFQPQSNNVKRSSITTIDEGYSNSDETPILSQPATFYTMKSTNKDYSPKIISEPSQFDHFNNQNELNDLAHSSEQDDTLINENSLKKPNSDEINSSNLRIPSYSSTVNNNSSITLTNNSSIDNDGLRKPNNFNNDNSLPSPSNSSFSNKNPPKISIPQPPPIKSSETIQQSGRRPSNTSILTNGSKFKPSTPQQYSGSSKFDSLNDTPNTINTVNTISTNELLGTPKSFFQSDKKSPHLRSNSTFSLKNPSSPFSKPEIPGRHRRSNTLGDLNKYSFNDNQSIRSGTSMSSVQPPTTKKSKLSETTTKSSSKKFSFRNLFKLKSKNHSLNEKANNNSNLELPSQPKKLKNKSASTPNFTEIGSSPTSIVTTNTTATASTEKKKLFGNKNRKKNDDSKSIAPNSPQKSQVHPPLNKSSSSSSILNVFKKNKSTDTLGKKLANDEKTNEVADKDPVVTSEIGDELSINHDNLTTSKAYKSNSNINFIREVSDDDYNPNLVYNNDSNSVKQPKQNIESQADLKDNEDDSINLRNNPPTKLSNGRFDEEMSIDPPTSSSAMNVSKGPLSSNHLMNNNNKASETFDNDDDIFGSPFDVSYDSSNINTPRIVESQIPSQPKHLDSSSSKINDQLIGEALFPKSLSVQEVESIVSLERSRSMKSIGSNNAGNKRNSFANYNGSDENIIHGSNMPISKPNNGIKRSSSILKNSHSKKNLKVDPLDASMNSIDANILSKDDTIQTVDDVTEDNNYQQFIDFADFIDLDNLDFTNSPKDPSPTESVTKRPQHLSPPDSANQLKNGLNQPPASLLSTPPVSQTDQNQLSPSPVIKLDNNSKDESTLLADNEGSDSYDESLVKTLNKKTTNSHLNKEVPQSPESIIEKHNPLEESPILETAYKTSTNRLSDSSNNAVNIDENGKSDFNNRPISMSFKGLKGPSFGGKLALHDIRSSDSHQSFNISFGDDSTEDEFGGVGGGFGSELDDAFDSDDASDKENLGSSNPKAYSNSKLSNSVSASNMKQSVSDVGSISSNNSKKFGNSNSYSQRSNNGTLPPPNHPYHHDKIPSLSDTSSSSPRSFSSIISKIKKSNNSPYSSPKLGPIKTQPLSFKDGVRFSSRIILYDTYNGEEYDRHPDTATCNQLTPLLAQQIKEEINLLKSEMEVHEESHCYTHFI